jgi:hypothetical protein
MNGFLLQKGIFSFYNVLERFFLRVFSISYHANTTHCGRIIYVKISFRRASPSPRRQIRETSVTTPNLRHFCTSNRLLLHPEPLVFESLPRLPRHTTTYHVLPRHITYYQAFCTPNLQHFPRRIFCLLHLEPSTSFLHPGTSHTMLRIGNGRKLQGSWCDVRV